MDCVPDEAPAQHCPTNMVPNELGGCSPAPPVACEPGYRRGTINGASACMPAGSQQPGVDNVNRESHNTATTTGTSTTNTTVRDASGTVTGSQTSVTTQNQSIDLNTTGLASEATLRGILDGISGMGMTTEPIWSPKGDGSAPSFNDVDARIDSDKAALNHQLTLFKASIGGLITPLTGGVSAIPCDGGFTLSNGVHGSICFNAYSSNLARLGQLVLFLASVSAVMLVVM